MTVVEQHRVEVVGGQAGTYAFLGRLWLRRSDQPREGEGARDLRTVSSPHVREAVRREVVAHDAKGLVQQRDYGWRDGAPKRARDSGCKTLTSSPAIHSGRW
jgi:hypothetical protein